MEGRFVVAILPFCVVVSFSSVSSAQEPQPIGSEILVNTFTTGGQSRPAVAMDASGNHVVTWQSTNQDNPGFQDQGVFGQLFDPTGNPVGGEFLVNTYTSFRQRDSTVSMDAAGNFVVVWESSFQGGGLEEEGIFGQRYDADGAILGDEFQINVFTPDEQARPDVASRPNGDFVVVWESDKQEFGSDLGGIFGRRFLADGTPGGEFHVNTYTNQAQAFPEVAIDEDGDFVVVWTSYNNDQDGDLGGVFGQLFTPDGTPTGDEFLVNSTTTGWQGSPDVAMDAAGNFLVAWTDYDGLDGDNNGIFARRFLADGDPVGDEFQVNTFTGSAQSYPAVASDWDGNFVVVWESYPAPPGIQGADIVGQLFANNGQPVGGEFQVNTYTPGYQREAAISVGSDGEFIVAWSTVRQDDPTTGILAQRLEAAPIFADGFESEDTSAWSNTVP